MSGKLRVRNYQAIGDVTLDLTGLTVITGRSNLGKSALIRAAESMLFGNPGDHYVKRGEQWTGGTIILHDVSPELKIGWRKVPAEHRKPNLQPSLTINGIQHTKIGRDHKQLTAPYGIIELETSAGRLRPQVANQHDPVFLVTENETAVAEVFKVLGRVDVITEAQRLARTDLKKTGDLKDIRKHDRKRAEERWRELDYVPVLKNQLEKTSWGARHLQSKAKELRQRQEQLKELQQLEPRLVPKPPVLPDLRPKVSTAALLKELNELTPRNIPTPPQLTTPDRRAESLMGNLQTLTREIEQVRLSMRDHEVTLGLLQEEKATMEKELGTCPTCKRRFDGHHDTSHQGP